MHHNVLEQNIYYLLLDPLIVTDVYSKKKYLPCVLNEEKKHTSTYTMIVSPNPKLNHLRFFLFSLGLLNVMCTMTH